MLPQPNNGSGAKMVKKLIRSKAKGVWIRRHAADRVVRALNVGEFRDLAIATVHYFSM